MTPKHKGKCNLPSEHHEIQTPAHRSRGHRFLGLSLAAGTYNGKESLYHLEVTMAGITMRFMSTLQSKLAETTVSYSVSAMHNGTNITRYLESELDTGQDVLVREIAVDNVDVIIT